MRDGYYLISWPKPGKERVERVERNLAESGSVEQLRRQGCTFEEVEVVPVRGQGREQKQ